MKAYKVLLLGFLFLFATQTLWAQSDRREQRKIERAEKKRLKQEARKKNHELLMTLIKDQAYVLEANTISGRFQQFRVNPSTNFVKIEGNRIVVQTGNNFSVGYNGLGGLTIDGRVRSYQISEGKNGVSVMVQFSDPLLGFSTLFLDVQHSGLARARVQGNWGRGAIFQGRVFHLQDSQVFKGRTII